MKPFWKNIKKKPKSKPVAPSKPTHPPRPRPEPWKPPAMTHDIPKAEFKVPVHKEKNEQERYCPRAEFVKTFNQLAHRHHKWQIWSDFATMFACTISNSLDKSHYDEREKLYLDLINKYDKRERNLFPELTTHTIAALEENPEQDFLGSIYSELGLTDDGKKQIFTPYSVCQLMTAMTMENVAVRVAEKGFITVNDPCCGAGATLIAAVNEAKHQLGKAGLNFQNHILIVGQDIEPIVTMMCYIQLSLLGVAGYFKVGNSITEPMTEVDSLTDYWFTPMYFSPVWNTRRIAQKMDSLFKEGTRERWDK